MIKLGDKGVALPYSFAWDLLNCQIQLQLCQFLNPDLFHKMSSLCQLGIDYYLTIHSSKFEYFKRRLHHVKLKQHQLCQPSPNTPQQKRQKITKQVSLTAQTIKNTEITNWLEESDKKIKQYNEEVRNVLERQKEQIAMRIKGRNRKAFRSFVEPSKAAGDQESTEGITIHSFYQTGISGSSKFLYQKEEGI